MKKMILVRRAALVAALLAAPVLVFAQGMEDDSRSKTPPKVVTGTKEKPSPATQAVLDKADALNEQKNHAAAILLLKGALENMPRQTPRFERDMVLLRLADSHYRTGKEAVQAKKYDAAIAQYQAAYNIEVVNHFGDGMEMHANIGYANEMRGNYSQAIVSYNKAAEGYHNALNSADEAKMLRNLGNVYSRRKNFSDAANAYGKSLAIVERAGDKGAASEMLRGIGLASDNARHFDKAGPAYARALLLMQERGDAFGEANTLYDIMLHRSHPKNPRRDNAAAIFWGMESMAALRRSTAKGGGTPETAQNEKVLAEILTDELAKLLRTERRDSDAQTVKTIGKSDIGLSELPPPTATEATLSKQYRVVLDAVTQTDTAYRAVLADGAATFDQKQAAQKKRDAAQEAFADFVRGAS